MEPQGLEALQQFIGDNPQALEVFNAAKTQFDGTVGKLQEYETKFAQQETKMADIVTNRDKLKNTVRDTLGINEVSKEAIIEKMANTGDAQLKATFEQQLQEVKSNSGQKIDELTAKLGGYESDLRNAKLQLAISKTDIMGQTQGEKATEILLGLLADNAEFNEDGSVKYVGAAGETVLNAQGNPMSLEDKINGLKASKEYDFLFQSRFLNGGGAPTNKPGGVAPVGNPASGAKLTRTTMGQEDKEAYVAKYGFESYNKLPLV